MAKTLCDYKRKEIEKDPQAFAQALQPVQFICLKCARLCSDKKQVCRAKKIK